MRFPIFPIRATLKPSGRVEVYDSRGRAINPISDLRFSNYEQTRGLEESSSNFDHSLEKVYDICILTVTPDSTNIGDSLETVRLLNQRTEPRQPLALLRTRLRK